MKNRILTFALAIAATIAIVSCDKDEVTPVGDTFTFTPDTPNLQNAVQTALIEMNDNDIIEFTEGEFLFTNTLSIDDKTNITLIGAGKEKTILDFSNQTQGGSGAQGIIASKTDQILFKDFTIQDADGDNIKVKDSDGVSFINLSAVYTGPVTPENGAYSLYPVTSKNVYITGCYIRGASDAGIYVGQSENVIVSNNEVVENVAGIEIENCIASDVFGNNVHDNTGGILIFDLPGLPIIENGRQTRIFDNVIKNNNHDNFAPQGNMVGIVPPGSGLMMLACREVEVFNNEVSGNNFMPISMYSYTILRLDDPDVTWPESFDPNLQIINIHDNDIAEITEAYNPNQSDLGGALIYAYNKHPEKDLFNNMPTLIWGGVYDVFNTGSLTHNICIQDNSSSNFVNLAAYSDFQLLNHDITQFVCTQNPLPEVIVNARK